jgi:hypothetical protein
MLNREEGQAITYLSSVAIRGDGFLEFRGVLGILGALASLAFVALGVREDFCESLCLGEKKPAEGELNRPLICTGLFFFYFLHFQL